MPPPTAEVLRCKRCGTILRGGRTACPSCGTEVGATSESPVPKSTAPRKGGWAQATESASLCPMCMATVSAEDLREYVAQLQEEIARVEEEISKKEKHLSAADAIFKKPAG